MSTPNPQQETELEKKINEIKRAAAHRFHEDHADGDLAIYQAVREMAELIQSELTKYAKAVDDEVVGPQFSNWGELETDEQGIESAKNKLKAKQRQAHAAIRERFGIGR